MRSKTQQIWLDSFLQLVAEGRVAEIDYAAYLEIFGEVTGHTNTLAAHGMNVTIRGQRITYDLLLPEFREKMWCTWEIKFDSRDLSKVLAISKETGHRYLVEKKPEIHMAAMEFTDEDQHELNRVNGYNKHHEAKMNKKAEEIYGTIDAINPEWARLRILKSQPVLKGQQKKLLQEANGIVDIEEQTEDTAPRTKDVTSIDWEKKALEDL
jgi:hypothetical protein